MVHGEACGGSTVRLSYRERGVGYAICLLRCHRSALPWTRGYFPKTRPPACRQYDRHGKRPPPSSQFQLTRHKRFPRNQEPSPPNRDKLMERRNTPMHKPRTLVVDDEPGFIRLLVDGTTAMRGEGQRWNIVTSKRTGLSKSEFRDARPQ
jgi:hypothetical protein